MKATFSKRLASCALAVVMAASLSPFTIAAQAGSAFADESDEPSVAAETRAYAPQTNVDSPVTITLQNEYPRGINIDNPAEVKGTATFKNNSSNPVRISQIQCDSSKVADYFDLDPQSKASLHLTSLYNEELREGWKPDATGEVYKSDTTGISADPTVGYVLPKSASTNADFVLNLTGSTAKDAAKEAAKSPGTDQELMKCTFVYEGVRGAGPMTAADKNAADFYLTDKRFAHEVTYSLAEVKADAEELPNLSAGNWLYDMYYDFCTGDGTNYECKVRWNNALYPLRIIGLNQDTRSDGQGMAGLTFMFMRPPVMNSNFGSAGQGWTESSITNKLREGGDLNSSVKNKLVQVRKSRLDRGSTAATTAVSNDKCFILSRYELGANISGGSGVLGVGSDRSELYLHFESLGMRPGGHNAGAAVIRNLGLANAWLRDRVDPVEGTYTIAMVVNEGYLDYAQYGHSQVHNFVPCFCL